VDSHIDFENALRIRKDFSRIPSILEIPNLIEIQKQTFDRFLQASVEPEKRENLGLQAVFNSVFPIKDFNDTASLEFVGYTLEEPKYDVQECLQRGMTYAAPFKVTIRLVAWDDSEGSQAIRDVKEQEVYFGEIPIMTENGTFIINGTERVIVSQLHRSPGIFFDTTASASQSSAGKSLYSCRIIPYRGSWLDLEFDHKDLLYARIDRRRKIYGTILLKALGYTPEELLADFYQPETVRMDSKRILKRVVPELLVGQRCTREVKDEAGHVLVRKDRKFTSAAVRRIQEAGIEWIQVGIEDLIRTDAVKRVAPIDVVDETTGEVIIECNEELSQAHLDELRARGIEEFPLLYLDPLTTGTSMRDTLLADSKTQTRDEAIIEIYRRLRPGDPPTVETATNLFRNLFFNPERYDLSRVGRLKLNHKLGFDPDQVVEAPPATASGAPRQVALRELTTLRPDDILRAFKYLVDLKNGSDPNARVDDIDHLGNRRVRVVGELLENQYRIGLVRMERAIKERMSLQEIETLMPHDLINSKPVSAVVKEFFGSSQLSQFMDQTNPLSAVTHKRRLSALGPGGLTRERAGFEVRDVHPTHYGRICPIETPEGPNIGLIASLSTYARVNDLGFIETPYRNVSEGRVQGEVRYLSALDEERLAIAQANAPLDDEGRFQREAVQARKGGEFVVVPPSEVQMMDVSPNQLVSVAASLIPFLENDDANRALMGSNMQRQAVPLMRTEAPLIGTGLEAVVARDSGVTVVAKRDGEVESVDASRIVIKPDDDGEGSNVDIINLIKYQRSNQSTCINQKPIVRRGQRVRKGQVIADGPATDRGELALGRNVVVAFMPWGGYNFEDSILISERVVKDDSYTSIHIEEFECVARDTKLGKEEITRDIPNVGEEALRDLDESGIVRIGAEVGADDVLVGKITPKGETQLSPEERLLRAIFGEKAGDVRDTSLRVPPGVSGTVIGAQVFSRRGVQKDDRAQALEEQEIERLRKDQEDEIRIVRESAMRKVRGLVVGKRAANRVADERKGSEWLRTGDVIGEEVFDQIPQRRWRDVQVQDARAQEQVDRIFQGVDEQARVIKDVFDEKIARLRKGDELPPGVFKMVKVYLAIRRKLSVGDKMAGRHGNKGVISRILPEEDMPYLTDGTPIDIVLNPLGVPSRMNVGQILETHLGWAARGLGSAVARMLAGATDPERLREALKELYADVRLAKVIDAASPEALLGLARNVSGGVHMATAVFDGAKEDEIRAELRRAGLPEGGKTILFDGRSGEPFDSEVTVGVLYMMKLHHLADDKIHARSIGPYSLVTQQPLGGKAQFGGQRLGEMEVWALEAYGAAFALQEFLTVKSDDVSGRTRIYESIVRGECALEPGLPESFNVLVKELQALGLDVDLMEDKS
jgi:DNA-directed RNA polymerase subunit beta